jgi:hypothetical protein
MLRARFLVGVMALAVFGGGWLLGDDTKKEPPPPKPKGVAADRLEEAWPDR